MKNQITRPPNQFSTITHNDFCVNNTMVLRDPQGAPLKNKMFDFQFTRLDSAAIDLIFFLFTSVINPILEKHLDELLHIYHETFVACLKDYDIDLTPFCWESFAKEVDDIGKKQAYRVVTMLKAFFTERGKITTSLEDFKVTEWERRDLLGDAYKKKLKDTILALAKRHWI